MSTKIIENFNQLCYTVCFVFFTASAAKNRTIRLPTKPVNTQLQKKLKFFHNYLYLNNLKFIGFYRSIDKTDTLKINSPAALLLFATFKHSISLYYWRFSPIYSYNHYFLQ